MYYVLAFIVGLIQGGVCMYLYVMERNRRITAREKTAQQLSETATAKEREVVRMRMELEKRITTGEAELAHTREAVEQRGKQKDAELRSRAQELEESLDRRTSTARAENQRIEEALHQRTAELRQRETAMEQRTIRYSDLEGENHALKQDLTNLAVVVNKLRLDGTARDQRQDQLDAKTTDLAKRYLAETVKWVGNAISASNYAACKQRLQDVITRCREAGFVISVAEEDKLIADLKVEFEREVKLAFEREEQARIKAQIREEQKLQKEIDREVQQAERERAAIKAALDRAMADEKDKHSDEIQRLEARLAEAEAKSQRAISMAQQTKAGNIYVISNIGSFGEDVFKVGMTRRLEPLDRVRELGDASVPFPFDVHMMIACEDAPTLESALHRALHKARVNRTNPRKEFFKTDIDTILSIVKENHGEVRYVADPEALEYRQSQQMSEQDSEYIEGVYEQAADVSAGAQED